MRPFVIACGILVACGTRTVEPPAAPITPTLTRVVPWHRLVPPPDVEPLRLVGEAAGIPGPSPAPGPRRSLEPHAPLGVIYGVAVWSTLCVARRDPRGIDRELALAYLSAWCLADAGALHDAREQLVRLVHAPALRIATAARADVIELLAADHLDGRAAIGWLVARGLDTDTAYDALAAAYVGYGRTTDAVIAIRSANRAPHVAPSVRCRRLDRELALDEGRGFEIRRELAQLERHDPVCRQIFQQLTHTDRARTCPLVSGVWSSSDHCRTGFCHVQLIEADIDKCAAFLSRDRALEPRAYLAAARAHWPRDSVDPEAWLAYARIAARALAADRGAELVIAALENAALLSNCEELPRARIAETTRALVPSVRPELEPRLRRLASLTRQGCIDTRADTLRRK